MSRRSEPTEAQLAALTTVLTFGNPTYMPYAASARSYEACERKGWLVYQSIRAGEIMTKLNGYELTDVGRALVLTSQRSRLNIQNAERSGLARGGS